MERRDHAYYVPRLISTERAKTVCLVGQGHLTCRFVIGNATGVCCAKKVPETRRMLDEKAARGEIVARGDNCSGLPLN